MQIGVDSGAVGMRRGLVGTTGCSLPDAAWEEFVSYTSPLPNEFGSHGVQVLDVNGDGQTEFVLRFGWVPLHTGLPDLLFQHIPWIYRVGPKGP